MLEKKPLFANRIRYLHHFGIAKSRFSRFICLADRKRLWH